LGCEAVQIVNLCVVDTSTVVELNELEQTGGWTEARKDLAQGIRGTVGLLAGWGVSGTTGSARRAREEQVVWLYQEAASAGIEHVWMVGGEPRHPSRWHQYVSDKYGRTSGGTFEQRLGQVLTPVPIGTAAEAAARFHDESEIQRARRPVERFPSVDVGRHH
jgi:hypothetical protein